MGNSTDWELDFDQFAHWLIDGRGEVSARTLGQLEAWFVRLASLLHKAECVELPAAHWYVRSLIDVQTELRALAEAHRVSLPWLPMEISDDGSVTSLTRLIAGIVEGLRCLRAHARFDEWESPEQGGDRRSTSPRG